ncbi:MAG: MFS transporter, partial [Gammaproteobacteria bacterium]
GGTFAASNAYLATVVSGHRLTRLLTLMQGSARAALFAGPALMGLAADAGAPLSMYRYLAVLPLLSAVLVWRLPAAGRGADQPMIAPEPVRPGADRVSPAQLYWLQCAFIFATVVTFPYFVRYAEASLPQAPRAAFGLLFGLPHLVYLLCAHPLSRWFGQTRLLPTLAASMALVAVALLGQAYGPALASMVAWRVLMGVAMTAGYIALHGLVAAITDAGNAGRRFGALEGSTKWGAVGAGLAAGIATDRWGLHMPFLIGAATLGLTALSIVFIVRHARTPLTASARHRSDRAASQP